MHNERGHWTCSWFMIPHLDDRREQKTTEESRRLYSLFCSIFSIKKKALQVSRKMLPDEVKRSSKTLFKIIIMSQDYSKRGESTLTSAETKGRRIWEAEVSS